VLVKNLASLEVAYPGFSVRDHAVARWVRGHDVGVHARSSDELGAVIAAGVHPFRVTVHADGIRADELVSCAGSLAMGMIVVRTVEQVELAARAVGRHRRQRVMVVTGDGRADPAAVLAASVAAPRLDLVGLHADVRVTTADYVSFPAAVGDLVSRIYRVWETHATMLTHLSLGAAPCVTGDWMTELGGQAEIIDQSLDDACLTLQVPRPTVTMAAVALPGEMRAA
jgi:hypothetical protein